MDVISSLSHNLMHVKSAVKQLPMENECVSSHNKFNHRELKETSSNNCTFTEMCLKLQKGFWCVWLFPPHTYVQAASESDKDLTWYLISADVLTNTSASMLSHMVGAISDSGVGTTLSKHMLQFCITIKRKNICYSDKLRQNKTDM